ncbi:MAG TPA: hypothetical protein VGL95_04080 [Acetobacteraceae bacterium]|jgi:hypothetical protein
MVGFLQDWRVAARLRAFSAWRRSPTVNQATGRAIFRCQPLPLKGRTYDADNDAGGCPGLRAQHRLHDALYLRGVLGLRPAPEFAAWLKRMGLDGTAAPERIPAALSSSLIGMA